MAEVEKIERAIILTDDEYFEQLDLLHELNQINVKKKKLELKLKRLQKKIKHLDEEEVQLKLKALHSIISELNSKKERIESELYEEFQFFTIVFNISKIESYIEALGKSFKKKKISNDVYNTTLNYYKKISSEPLKRVERIKVIAEAYLSILYNQKIDVHLKLKMNEKKNNESKKLKKLQSIIQEKQNFLSNQIINYKFRIVSNVN